MMTQCITGYNKMHVTMDNVMRYREQDTVL